MKKLTGLVLSTFLAAAPVAASQAQDPINLALGSVNASSGVYPFAVSLANAISAHDPGLNVTVVEGGGGFDHAKLMKQGVVDFSVSGSPAVAHAVATGTGNFSKEGAWEPIRLMFMRNVNVSRIYVSAVFAEEEDIKTWSDLSGQPFAPGVPGTRDMQRALAANDLLGSGIVMIPSSLEDATRKLGEGDVVGMLKGSPHDRFDAAMLSVHFSTPLTVIGYTDEEVAKLAADNPMNTFTETSRGGIREVAEVGPLNEMSSAVMVMSSSRLSQEVGHRMAKAVYAGWGDINVAYQPTTGLDPIADAIRHIPRVDGLYLHAGVVQLAKERNIDVPDRLIPPEYRD